MRQKQVNHHIKIINGMIFSKDLRRLVDLRLECKLGVVVFLENHERHTKQVYERKVNVQLRECCEDWR